MIELLVGRSFQLWDYRVSHGSLLIRSPRKSGHRFNVDIKYFGVEYVAVPRHLKEIVYLEANKDEVKYVERILGKSINKDNVFVLESSTGRHLIVASRMKIEESEFDIFDSSFD